MAANLEKRVDALERELKSLKSAVRKNKSEGSWWERLAGTFKDDLLFDEMVEAGRKYRKSQTRRSNGSNS
ncbi:MAG: hypothetical protein QOH41_2624 [Blastocatellia bacterium]|jgi:hypothetical protein|nr:hypothetical protein [Blastocatellia bacterium]